VGIVRDWTETLAAGYASRISISGDYLRVVSATGAIRVETDSGDYVTLQGAMALRGARRWESFTITNLSGASNAIVLAIGLGAVIDDTRSQIVGTVETTGGVPLTTWETDTIAHASATVTITAANPGVVTWAAHGLAEDDPLRLVTTGALPSPLVVGTDYYVVAIDAGTFSLSATPAGAAIDTSAGGGSGTHIATAPGLQLSASATRRGVLILASSANTGTVYAGPAGTPQASGIPLAAGASVPVETSAEIEVVGAGTVTTSVVSA